MSFAKIKKVSRRDAVIEQVIAALRSGNYHAGDRLPSEAALGEAMGVGRSSVREALQGLEMLGIVERTTSGAVIADQYSVKVISRYLYIGLSQEQFDLSHVFDARRVLETELGAMAAVAIEDNDIAELRSIHAEMLQLQEDDVSRYIELNRAFHVHIGELAKSPVLFHMWQLTDDLLRQAMELQTGPPRGFKLVSDERHEQLLLALQARDSDRVRMVIEESLRLSASVLNSELNELAPDAIGRLDPASTKAQIELPTSSPP